MPLPRLGTDARRVLQLVLAAIWLLDGLLQYQSFMYTELAVGVTMAFILIVINLKFIVNAHT